MNKDTPSAPSTRQILVSDAHKKFPPLLVNGQWCDYDPVLRAYVRLHAPLGRPATIKED